LVGQAVVGIGFSIALIHFSGWMQPDLSFIRDTGFRLGVVFYVWAFLMIAASANGVNLTDGLDGLASGSSALVLAAYLIISFWEFRHSCFLLPRPSACYPIHVGPALDVAIVSAGAMGAVAGFLCWNAAPPKSFMRDTGSLARGRRRS